MVVSGVWSRWVSGVLGVLLAGTLVAADLPVASATTEAVVKAGQQQAVVESVPASDGRPDAVSAQVTARASGQRVEDLSARSGSERLFANPDGTWTLESFATAVNREAEDGSFTPVSDDPLLESGTDMTVEGAVSEVVVADGGDVLGQGPTDESVPLVRMSSEHQGQPAELVVGWEGRLPAPATEGSQAVFADAATAAVGAKNPAVEADVAVQATVDGFAHQVLIDQDPGRDVEVRFPLGVSEGLQVTQDPESKMLRVVDPAGETVFVGSAPMMWDSSAVDARVGVPTEYPVQSQLVKEDGVDVLVLNVDRQWLSAAERTYPVTIDPVWTARVDADTWVQSGVTSAKATDPELRLGTFNGGSTKARSYLKFGMGSVEGTKVVGAKLKVWNTHSWSCTPASVTAQRVTAAWDPTTLVWANQPATTTTGSAQVSSAKGYSTACEAGWLEMDVTGMAQYWVDNPSQNHGVQLKATDEADNFGWKRFHSNDVSWVSVQPRVEVTFNSYPLTPTKVGFAAGQFGKDAAGKIWVNTSKPSAQASVVDPDGGQVRALWDLTSGGSILSRSTGSLVASGQTSRLTLPVLEKGRTYAMKAWGSDGSLTSRSASSVVGFGVDLSAPAASSITAGGYDAKGWAASAPASSALTFSSSSTDVMRFEYSVDGAAVKAVTATGSGPRTGQVSWSPKGAHQVQVTAIDRAGNRTASSMSFITGAAGLRAPRAGATSSDVFTVTAVAPSSSDSAVSARVYWREAGSNADADSSLFGSFAPDLGWKEAKDAPVTRASNGTLQVSTTLDVAAEPAGELARLGKERVPALIEVQVCFTYPSLSGAARVQCTTREGADATAVTRLPHAFGGNYPVAEAGSGQVALSTGELNVATTDVKADAGNTDLSVSRTYSSYSGLGADSAVLGSGWRLNIEGPDAGLGGLLVAEATGVDGTITLIDESEQAMVFRQPGGTRLAGKTGVYTAANDMASEAGLKVELTGSGTSARITVTEADGTTTTFVKGAVLDGAAVFEWVPEAVITPGVAGKTQYIRENGKITKVVAASDGVDMGATCITAPVKGCRVLNLAYTGEGRLATVSFTAFDPAKNAMATIPMASYTYTGTGAGARLTAVTDERSGEKVGYTYGTASAAGVPLLTRMTLTAANGQSIEAATEFRYGPGASSSRADWLEAVYRGDPNGGSGTVQTSRFVYGVNPAGDGKNSPNLSAARVGWWEQPTAPVAGAAVFTLNRPVSTSKASALPAGELRYGSLVFWDEKNRVVNNAYYADGAWQNDALVYNSDQLVERQYSFQGIGQVTDRAQALGLTSGTGVAASGIVPGHEENATLTEYAEAAVGASESVAAHVRSFPVKVTSPAVTNERGGTSRMVASTEYTPVTDIDATGMPRMLAVRESAVEVEIAAAGGQALAQDRIVSDIRKDYDAMESFGGKSTTDKTNPRSGWVHRIPTTETTSVGAGRGPIVARTWLDESGRTIREVRPTSTGTDAGTSKFVYYTAGTNAVDAQCGNRPEFAGRLCAILPLGTGSVTERTTGYNIYGDVTSSVEAASGATGGPSRMTMTTYRTDGQINTVAVSTAGLTGSTSVPVTTYLYDGAGREVGRKTPQGTVTSTLDGWGRTISYTNQDGQTTTTTYNSFGQVAKVTDPYGTTSYEYGAVTGDGSSEFRGLPTRMRVSDHGASGTEGVYEAAYDRYGNLVTQRLPGGIIQRQDFDEDSRLMGLSYEGPVTKADGTETTAPWVGWGLSRDAAGRITGENAPEAVITAAAGGQGTERRFSYDQAGRLTKVADAATGESRQYTFDASGNRTSLTTVGTDGKSSTRSWTWDAADRISGAGYVYDGLGRVTTIPAADAPQGLGEGPDAATGSAPITVGYDDTDAAVSITRGQTTTKVSLDAVGRRHKQTIGARVVVNGYVDGTDNPGYAATTLLGDGSPVVTRYVHSLGGDLAARVENGSAVLQLANPHGDVVTEVDVTTAATVSAGMSGWTAYDEYGNSAQLSSATVGNTYRWHGADQRGVVAAGLILMGARLYNPATGQFTTRDPVRAGGATPYGYPYDPVNGQDVDGKFWKKARELWNNPWVQAATWLIPGAGVIKGAWTGYKVYKILRAASAGRDFSSATRGQSYIAGRIWTGGVRGKAQTWRGGKQSFKLYHNSRTGRTYRSPTVKNSKTYQGRYSNFDKKYPRPSKSHVRIR